MPGSGANFLCCPGWDSFTLLCCVLSFDCLSFCPDSVISKAMPLSVNKRYSDFKTEQSCCGLWKLLPLNGYRYLPFQINNWTAQSSIIYSKHSENVEGVVLEGAKGKGGEKGWKWSNFEVFWNCLVATDQNSKSDSKNREESSEQGKGTLCLCIIAYCSCVVDTPGSFCLPHSNRRRGLERIQKRTVSWSETCCVFWRQVTDTIIL